MSAFGGDLNRSTQLSILIGKDGVWRWNGDRPLAKIPEKAVDAVIKWYDGNYGLFIFRGGKFLSNIFPNFTDSFEKKLVELVKSGDSKKVSVVLAVLRNYEGNPFIHRVCKELIKVFPGDSLELREVAGILESTGVVSGEYGFVEAFERKKEEMKDWLNDQDERIRAFAGNYLAELDKRIEWQRQRADEDIALRKFKYGADENR